MVGLLRSHCNREATTARLSALIMSARSQRVKRSASQPLHVARRPKKLPDADADAVVTEYLAGKTMNDIARERNLHRTTIAAALERAGVAQRPKGMNAEQVDHAVKLYTAGLSLATVGSRLGFTARTIRAELLRHGVKMRPRPGWSAVE